MSVTLSLPGARRFVLLLALSAAGTSASGEEPAESTGKKPRPLVIDAARDPLEVLRERLAQKLGAIKAPDTPNPNVVRVVTRSPVSSGSDTLPVPMTAAVAEPMRPRLPKTSRAARPPRPSGDWNYSGSAGPEFWGHMSPEFSKCSSGTRQSPIDIRDGIKVELDPVRFDYRPSAFRVVDNGHTVQVNLAEGNAIEVMGRRYELVQFHFHRPSEERIEGKQFEMVVHLVHKDLEGRFAMVAVLLDRGDALPVVQSVWNNLPLEKGEEVAARATLDPNELLPAERHYFTFMGSLTTPPCSEGVLWMVMKRAVPVSADQIAIFARLYPMNARPVQAASGRLIKESN